MLPAGRLSNHGYTVKWGFFSGVCTGSFQLPFEQSCALIADAVRKMEENIAQVSSHCDDLENIESAVNQLGAATVHVYPRHGHEYFWKDCPVINFAKHDLEGGHSYYSCDYVFEERAHKIEAYDKSFGFSSPAHWVHFLNCKYAAHLRKQNSQRRDWVTWQKNRLANWAPKPLTPR